MAGHAEGAKNICVPFAGIGRAMVAMARPDTVIESWDTMHYSRCIVDGVFTAEEIETNVDGIHYRKGWAFEHRPYKNIDDRCAGFIDWVAQEGTLYDKACLGSAMTRCTLMGRLTHWHANIEQLYKRFQKQFEYNRDWLAQPGTYVHHEGNFFDSNSWGKVGPDPMQPGYTVGETPLYDLLEIDPPKVVNYSDVYSLHFNNFNKALTQGGATLPKWTRRNSLGYFRKCLAVLAPKVIFMYVSGVMPRVEDVEKVLRESGEITEKQEFVHSGRTDYGFVLER
jgi:hypothetical protein